MIVKVCGMRDAQNIKEVEALGIDMMGFIFYPNSKRHCAEVPAYLPTKCNRVGVFVNADLGYIKRHIENYTLDFVQLHGNESPEFCKVLLDSEDVPGHIGIIKAIQISSAEDLNKAEQYEEFVDYFLFETKCEGYGGSGRQFDWSLLKDYKGETPFLLTGGIGPEDAGRIRDFHNPRFAGIDLNSRFETTPGLKDTSALKRFLDCCRG